MEVRMESKSKEMKSFINNVSAGIFGVSKEEAIKSGLCVSCKQPAMSGCYSDAGVREYNISGICERCFDRITGGGDE